MIIDILCPCGGEIDMFDSDTYKCLDCGREFNQDDIDRTENLTEE